MIKRTFASALVLAALGGTANYAAAEILVRVAPPLPRPELVPLPRRGYIWAPGHWEWRRQQHVWITGSWLQERPGYRYYGPNSVQRNGRWAMHEGHWAKGGRGHDDDRMPNSRHGSPNNPDRR